MAYSIHFAPPAVKQISAVEPSIRVRLLHTLEHEAAAIKPDTEKAKKLRRVNVDNHRMVLLEIHPTQQLLVLKVADPDEIGRRLRGEPDPEPIPEPAEPEPKQDLEASSTPEPDAPEAESPPEAPSREDTEKTASPLPDTPQEATDSPSDDPSTATQVLKEEEPEPEESASNASEPSSRPESGTEPPAPESQQPSTPRTFQGQPVPSLGGLKKAFLEEILAKAPPLLEPDADVEDVKDWAREIASNGGTLGFFDITQRAREVLLGVSDDVRGEAIARILETARREMEQL